MFKTGRFSCFYLVVVFLAAFDGALAAWSVSPGDALADARSAVAAGKRDRARRLLRIALELAPVEGDLWSSALLLAARNFPALVSEFTDGRTGHLIPLALFPEDDYEGTTDSIFPIPEKFYELAFLPPRLAGEVRWYLEHDKWKKGVQKLEAFLDEHPDNIRLLALLGRIYEDRGRFELAWDRYNAALDRATLDEDLFLFQVSLFRLLLKEKKLFVAEKRLYLIEKSARERLLALEKEPSSLNLEKRERYLAARRRYLAIENAFGVLKIIKGQKPEAKLLFKRVLEYGPGHLVAVLNSIHVRRMLYEREGAINHMLRLVNTFSSLLDDVMTLHGNALAPGGLSGLEQLDKSSVILKKILCLLNVRLGSLYLDVYAYERAYSCFEDASGFDPGAGLPHFYAGLTRERQGNIQAAQQCFRQALARSKENPGLAGACNEKIGKLFELEAHEILRSKTRSEKIAEEAMAVLDVGQLSRLKEQIEKGRQLLDAGDFRQAYKLFSRLSRLHPECADVPYFRGISALLCGRFRKAVDGFLSALEVDPDHAPAKSELAYLKMERNIDLAGAYKMSEAAYESAPDEPVIQVNHAWILFRLGEREEAYSLLKKALEHSPQDILFHYRAGLMYFRDELYNFAVKKFDDVLKLHPDYPRALMMKGLTLARLGMVREALEPLSRSLDGLSNLRGNRRVVLDTIAVIKKALDAGTPDSDNPHAMAVVKVEEALSNRDARALQSEALKAVEGGFISRGRALLQQGAEQFPRYANLSVDLGFLELLNGRLEEAKKALDRVLDYHGMDLRALAGYGHIDFRRGCLHRFVNDIVRLREIPAGLAYSELLERIGSRWKELSRRSPGDADLNYELGRVEMFSGELDEAVKTLTAARGAEKNLYLGEAYLRRFVLTKNEEDYQNARDYLGRGAYRYVRELPSLYSFVTSPHPRSVEKENPFREPLGRDDGWSEEIRRQRERLYTAEKVNVKGTGLLKGRWRRLDSHLEEKWRRERDIEEREAEVESRLGAGDGLVEIRNGETGPRDGTPEKKGDETGASRPETATDSLSVSTAAGFAVQHESEILGRVAMPVERLACRAFVELPEKAVPVEARRKVSQARIAAGKGLVDKADTLLSQAARIAPGWATPRVDKLVLECLSGRLDTARETLENCRADPVCRLDIVDRASCLLDRVSDSKSDSYLSDEASFHPGRTGFIEYLAGIWDRVIEACASDPGANLQRGMLAFVSGEWDVLRRCKARLSDCREKRMLESLMEATRGT